MFNIKYNVTLNMSCKQHIRNILKRYAFALNMKTSFYLSEAEICFAVLNIPADAKIYPFYTFPYIKRLKLRTQSFKLLINA